MPPVGFKPMISAGERPQTYALDCTFTGAGHICFGLCILILDVENTRKCPILWLKRKRQIGSAILLSSHMLSSECATV